MDNIVRSIAIFSLVIGICGLIIFFLLTLLSSSEDSSLKKSVNGSFFFLFSLMIFFPLVYLLTPDTILIDPKIAENLGQKPVGNGGGGAITTDTTTDTTPSNTSPKDEKEVLCVDGIQNLGVSSSSDLTGKLTRLDRTKIKPVPTSSPGIFLQSTSEHKLKQIARDKMRGCTQQTAFSSGNPQASHFKDMGDHGPVIVGGDGAVDNILT